MYIEISSLNLRPSSTFNECFTKFRNLIGRPSLTSASCHKATVSKSGTIIIHNVTISSFMNYLNTTYQVRDPQVCKYTLP